MTIENLALQKLLEIEKNISEEFISFNVVEKETEYVVSASWNGYKWVIFNIESITNE